MLKLQGGGLIEQTAQLTQGIVIVRDLRRKAAQIEVVLNEVLVHLGVVKNGAVNASRFSVSAPQAMRRLAFNRVRRAVRRKRRPRPSAAVSGEDA